MALCCWSENLFNNQTHNIKLNWPCPHRLSVFLIIWLQIFGKHIKQKTQFEEIKLKLQKYWSDSWHMLRCKEAWNGFIKLWRFYNKFHQTNCCEAFNRHINCALQRYPTILPIKVVQTNSANPKTAIWVESVETQYKIWPKEVSGKKFYFYKVHI